MSEKPQATKVILYPDGGYLQDKHIGGWGVHGYTFFDEEPKRGTGNPKAVPSDKGYLFEGCVGNKVTIHQYIDMIGGGRDWGSNNEVEVIALTNALQWLTDNPHITHAIIRSDSKFAIQGTTEWLSKWEKRNWMSPRGEPIKYRPTWEAVKALYEPLMERMEHLEINHVKGHSGDPGNTKADALATRGIVLGKNKDVRVFRKITEAQGYWKVSNQCPRILQAPRWYFYTGDDNHKREDGSYVYYVGCHGGKDKEDDLAGKPYADNFLGVVHMVSPDPVLEKLREEAYERDPMRHGKLVLGHLDTIFSPKTYAELDEYGPTFLQSHKKRLDILDSKDVVVMTEQKPLGLGFRQVAMWESLAGHLEKLLVGSPNYRTTDLTDLLYEEQGKKKTALKLKPKYTQITKYLDVDVEFNLEVSDDEPKPFIGNVRLVLGGDILTRNQLAAISEEVKSVKVVTWRESELVGRYATLVELNSGEVGLWARTEANLYYRLPSPTN